MASKNGESKHLSDPRRRNASGIKDSLVIGTTSEGIELRATLVRLTRFVAVFEVFNPSFVLRMSEVLDDFKIVLRDRTVYSGRAVITGLVSTGTVLVCEARLDDTSFCVATFSPADAGEPRDGFDDFLTHWQKNYKVQPEFKVVIADMQTFLSDLRVWLEQVELQIRSAPTGDRIEMEREKVEGIGRAMVPAFDALHERLEELSGKVEADLHPVHQSFARRQLHPLMLCSPFAYRTYHKPLGYAGDYEMVNMILRSPFEGGSLYAKVVNLWFLSQWPAKAHRNRIDFLKNRLVEECSRGERLGKPIRVLNLGCGPAREIQDFLQAGGIAEFADFTLLDFSEEAVQHTGQALESLRHRLATRTPVQIQKQSVHQFLRNCSKPTTESGYDLIYSAGLFDYLLDRTCRQLMDVFYSRLEPGGLIVATNVDDTKPFRHMLEFVLDWHLNYRSDKRCDSLFPERAQQEECRLLRDETGVNVFIEVRKPDHA